MTALPMLEEIDLLGVVERGVADRERIALVVKSDVDIGNFALALVAKQVDGSMQPLRDHFLWFGSGMVRSGDVVLIYTAPGTGRTEPIAGSTTGGNLHVLHWGKERTIFHNSVIEPVLFRLGGIQYEDLPPAATQGRLLEG